MPGIAGIAAGQLVDAAQPVAQRLWVQMQVLGRAGGRARREERGQAMILQLTACGGLYPVETLPAPFRAIHPFLPMSHLVDGLRVTISGGNTAHLVADVLVLAGFLVDHPL